MKKNRSLKVVTSTINKITSFYGSKYFSLFSNKTSNISYRILYQLNPFRLIAVFL